jgi:uncharacterized protein (TIGR02217 family)
VFPIELAALGMRSAWSTTVVELASGAEQRNVNWGDARRRYNATNSQAMTLANFRLIEKHFNARRGRGRSYPLRDRSAYQATTEPFGTGGGIASTNQLVVNDGDSGNAYTREIYLPETGTIHIYANAVEKTEGVHWTLAYSGATAGTVTWLVSVSGQSLTWTGNYYVPVRYDVDELDGKLFFWTESGGKLVEGPDIPLVEVRYLSEF